MILKLVNRYTPGSDDWRCVDENGDYHIVDFWVDGAISESTTLEKGMRIEVDYLHPHLEIAHNPRIIKGGRDD